MVIPILHSRELSRRLGINLARWKRWSREFLPPDPLAGIQSGYARQYYLDDAFRVYLGGHLVAHLHLSVPDARQVLSDLSPWMKSTGMCFDLRGQLGGGGAGVQAYEVHLHRTSEGFAYRIRGLIERHLHHPGPPEVWSESWTEATIGNGNQTPLQIGSNGFFRTIRLSILVSRFQVLMANPDQGKAQVAPLV
jgi:hypothetical protein